MSNINNHACSTASFQQLTKLVLEEGAVKPIEKNIYPISIVQAIFDGISGTRLDQLLSNFNCINVEFKGTIEATRLGVGINLRRKGLIIVYTDFDNNIHTERYINNDSIADDAWQLNTSWEDCFINIENSNIINELKEYIDKVIKDSIGDSAGFNVEVVEELPPVGQPKVIYLKLIGDTEGNIYEEYIWVSTTNKYEKLGGFGDIIIDDNLSTTSQNPVQNKVVTEAINKINKKLFPLSISVSGGGVFEKRTTQTITIRWSITEGSDKVIPDKLTVNSNLINKTDTSAQFTNVTTNQTYTVVAVKNGITVQGSASAVFVNPRYFGAVDINFSPTEENIKTLTKSVANTKSLTQTVALTNQKLCYAYPKAFGALTSIKDANNFDYIGSYERSEINVWGEPYYIYILKDATTIDDFKQIFN